MIAGMIAVVILLCSVSWVAFSFWVGGIVGDKTHNDGLATITAMTLIGIPIVFVIGEVFFG